MGADVAAIAAKLTGAQREMILWAGGHVLLRPGFTRWRLRRKRLIEPFLPENFRGAGWCLAERGEAVRAHLLAGDEA